MKEQVLKQRQVVGLGHTQLAQARMAGELDQIVARDTTSDVALCEPCSHIGSRDCVSKCRCKRSAERSRRVEGETVGRCRHDQRPGHLHSCAVVEPVTAERLLDVVELRDKKGDLAREG